MGGKPRAVRRTFICPPDESGLPQDEASKIIRAHAQHFVDWCACCSGPAEGNYSIHRDGFGEGPEVWLCDDCGKDETPTCEEIWARIAENEEMWKEFERILKSGGKTLRR